MTGTELRLAATDLKYGCKKGEDCTAPKQQNLLLIIGTKDSK